MSSPRICSSPAWACKSSGRPCLSSLPLLSRQNLPASSRAHLLCVGEIYSDLHAICTNLVNPSRRSNRVPKRICFSDGSKTLWPKSFDVANRIPSIAEPIRLWKIFPLISAEVVLFRRRRLKSRFNQPKRSSIS